MALQELEKESLGKKHQNYNTLLKMALARKDPLQPVTDDGNDIENLLKIDMACSTKNVQYVLDVFKSNDMLYVSRAIKRSTWLITDKQYAPYINIQYLSTQLFPFMMTKAINKLLYKIRLDLRDHERVEDFYNYYEKAKDVNAIKWLQNCSLHFIEDVLKNLSCYIPVEIFKRLCKKSITIIKVYLENDNIYTYDTFNTTMFLLNSHPETYLDILESNHHSNYPTFGIKYTKIVMKSFSARVISNFEKYIHCIHFPTFAKYLNEDQIRKIVTKDFKVEYNKYYVTYDNMRHLIKQMTKDGNFECLKKNVIDKVETDDCNDCVMYNSIANMNWYPFKTYRLYEFAPFAEAFTELKKLIRIESSPAERNVIICFLLNCAGQDSDKLLCVLQYYHDKHMNEPLKFKISFINCLLKNIKININEKNWDVLNRLFHSIEVYTETGSNNTQECIHAIIVHNAIVGEKNPDIIENKYAFDTLKKYRSKLNIEEKEKVFQYLYNFCLSKIDEKEIVNNFDFIEAVQIVTNILQLFVDWEKELQYYPLVLNKIKQLAKLKKDKDWNTSLATFYNLKKSWRKYMFEESLVLYPTEEVCINALKHDTGLLTRYKGEIVKISRIETLTRFLNKLRMHWPHSIMTEWKNMYIADLENISSHKSIIRGLMTILPHPQLQSIIKKYAPAEIKIDWNEHDASVFSIRKHIAKTMYLSRPLISVDMVLIYAKGDYLQYTVPSLNSIFHSQSQNQSYMDIPNLLKSPVSLQKYGIRFAVTKIATKEVIPMFLEAWKSTKNTSIRSVLFIQTFRAMCKANNSVVAEELLSLLSIFIHNLSAEENKNIYNCLGQVKAVPRDVSGKFFMKSYVFLKSLPPKANCEQIVKQLVKYAPEVMELLDDDFVTEMLKDVGETLKSECNFLGVISSFLMSSKDEETQKQRFKAVLLPLMDKYLPLWNEEYNKTKYIQNNFQILLQYLITDVRKYIHKRKQIVPLKLFLDIQIKLEQLLSKQENYVILTEWKLKVAFVMLLERHKSILLADIQDQIDDNEDIIWNKIFLRVLSSYAKTCYDILKEDTRKFLNIIYIFNGVVQKTLAYLSCTNRMNFFKYILDVNSSSEDYANVIYMCPTYPFNEEEETSLQELRELLNEKTPPDVKMHYHYKFDNL